MEGLSEAIVTDVRDAGTVALILLGGLVAETTAFIFAVRIMLARETRLQTKCDDLAREALQQARTSAAAFEKVTESLQSIDWALKNQRSPIELLREYRDLMERLERERTRG